jgi:protoheme ferro-lyase
MRPAVKRYLRQFLSDKRVVDTSRLLWWPLLRGVILPIRSPRVAKLYQSVDGRGIAADGIQPSPAAGAGQAAGYPGGAGHELWFAVAGQRGG